MSVQKSFWHTDAAYSSASDDWETPQWLFDRLDAEFSFELDVCASSKNAKCKRFFTKEENGLEQRWTGTCWLNPPYGKEIGQWLDKAVQSARDGATVVCLVPARTDTSWWWRTATKGEVRLLRGRLKFNDSGTAPFASAVLVFSSEHIPRVVHWGSPTDEVSRQFMLGETG